MMLNLFICLTTVLLCTFTAYVWKHWRYFYLGLKIPSCKGMPVCGYALVFVTSSLENVSQYMIEMYRKNRENSLVKVWMGLSYHVFLTDPDMVKKILVTALHKARFYETMSGTTGQGLVQHMHLPKWAKHRKIIGASFQFTALKSYIPIFFEEGNVLVEKIKPFAVARKSFEAFQLVGLAAFSSILRTIFEVDLQIQQNYNSKHPYLESVESTFMIFQERIFKPWLLIDFFNEWFGYKVQLKTNRLIRRAFIENIIEMIKSRLITINDDAPQLRTEGDLQGFICFAENVLKANQSPKCHPDVAMSEEELLHEMVSLLTAGFDTVTITISFALNILAIHSNIQQEVFDEIKSILADNDTIPTYNQLQNLRLLDRVIKETMRLFPAGPLIARSSPYELACGDYTIPADTNILIFIYGMHRDPKFWPNPNQFDPDRFLPSEIEKRNPNCYLPFSIGSRNCIGNKYAMLEMKTIMSSILNKYRILPGDHCKSIQDIRFEFGMTLRPLPGNDIRLELRDT